MVEMRVEQDGETILVYCLRTPGDAAEMMMFRREFLPTARFVVQPLRH